MPRSALVHASLLALQAACSPAAAPSEEAPFDLSCPSQPDLLPPAPACAAARGLTGEAIVCEDFTNRQTAPTVDALIGKGWDFFTSKDCWQTSNGFLEIKSFASETHARDLALCLIDVGASLLGAAPHAAVDSSLYRFKRYGPEALLEVLRLRMGAVGSDPRRGGALLGVRPSSAGCKRNGRLERRAGDAAAEGTGTRAAIPSLLATGAPQPLLPDVEPDIEEVRPPSPSLTTCVTKSPNPSGLMTTGPPPSSGSLGDSDDRSVCNRFQR